MCPLSLICEIYQLRICDTVKIWSLNVTISARATDWDCEFGIMPVSGRIIQWIAFNLERHDGLRLMCERSVRCPSLSPYDMARRAKAKGLDHPPQTPVEFEHGHRTMILPWLNGREAAEIGAALADEFAPRTESAVTRGSQQSSTSGSMEQLLQRADSEVRPLQLNFYKKAKFANSFKWRLIENGVAREIADDVTQPLVMHLSQSQVPASNQKSGDAPADRPDRDKAQHLFHHAGQIRRR
jgi:hypothetical protein